MQAGGMGATWRVPSGAVRGGHVVPGGRILRRAKSMGGEWDTMASLPRCSATNASIGSRSRRDGRGGGWEACKASRDVAAA
jgi:hypothetical protein